MNDIYQVFDESPKSEVCDLGVENFSFVDFHENDNILSNSFNNGFDDFYTVDEKL